uniref:Transmembrane protein 82 n=1 Tax=Denticeps clupeoides TaxID=299321 RepID=A0AAY4EGT5_9TELE
MLSFLSSTFPTLTGWLMLETNPLDQFLQGAVGACGIVVLCSLLRVYLFTEAHSTDRDVRPGEKPKHSPVGRRSGLTGALQFWVLAGILSVVGPRVASLVVLEFSLRAASARITGSRKGFEEQLLVQSQFSLGCALSCSLHFLHEGAPQRWLSLSIAAALSWYLAGLSGRLQEHVMALYRLHSSQRYCGVCIGLLSSGSSILPYLCRALFLTFAVAAVAAISTINQNFLSASEALRFWTPLTICYTLLVVYMQEEQHRQPSGNSALHTVVVRLGGLLVLMLTVGRWADVLHVLVCFLGEATCLLLAQDILDTATNVSIPSG